MKRHAWTMTWPVFAQALTLCTVVMLLFLIGEASGGRRIPEISPSLGLGAALWLAHCAASATTETVTEYLGQLPAPQNRLRTLVVDAGFLFLLVLVAGYLVVECSGLGIWLVDHVFERIRANDVLGPAPAHLYALDMAVLTPLVYWVAITVQLHTRHLARHWAFVWVSVEVLLLVGLLIQRQVLLRSGGANFLVAYVVLAAAAVLSFVLRRHCRLFLRGDARPASRALFST